MSKPESPLHKPALRLYLLGILCVVAGAGFTSLVGSMWPLAMGSSVAVMCTARWVGVIRERKAVRLARSRPPRSKRD